MGLFEVGHFRPAGSGMRAKRVGGAQQRCRPRKDRCGRRGPPGRNPGYGCVIVSVGHIRWDVYDQTAFASQITIWAWVTELASIVLH